ncbi:hypothetical protein MPSEU_000815700 [Mayamaea pseudoterrestris]|nr:hypothetical protein MPSEU_000815700 [Mayamaea pseudoterrestris]
MADKFVDDNMSDKDHSSTSSSSDYDDGEGSSCHDDNVHSTQQLTHDDDINDSDDDGSMEARSLSSSNDEDEGDESIQHHSSRRRLRRMNSIDSNEATMLPTTAYQESFSSKREIYLDEDGNVVYGDDASTTDRDDEEDVLKGATEGKQSKSSGLGLENKLAALISKQANHSADGSSVGGSDEAFRFEQAQASFTRRASKRRKPRKHLCLGDQLAKLPGAPTGRYLDQSADYTSIIGDDAATFIITRSDMEPPPPSRLAKRQSSSIVSDASSSHSQDDASTRSAAAVSVPNGKLVNDKESEIHPLPNETAEPTARAALEPTPAAGASPLMKHNSSQFQAVVLSFLACDGKVSVEHAARVISESINLVPENGSIFVFDYDGHIVQQLPSLLVLQLGLGTVDSETSRFHLNEMKKIMWRLGHSTTESQGRSIRAWEGNAKTRLQLTLQ